MKLGAQTVPVCRSFYYQELKEATKAFDKSMLLGEGSLGKVFPNTLTHEIEVLIRILSKWIFINSL